MQTYPLSQLILQEYEDTCKVYRKGDIHGRVTEGRIPGNEMCNYWMQDGPMYGKKPKGRVFLAIVGIHAGLPTLLVY